MHEAVSRLEEARNAILTSAYDRAIEACREVLARYPRHVEAACLLAEAYRETGQIELADGIFRRVLSADPESVLANWALGLVLRGRHREKEALAHLMRARELAPNNIELVNDLLGLAKDPEVAVKPTRAMLGRFYAAAGHYGRAADEFRGVLVDSPRRLDVWVALAETLWRDGEYDEALGVCEGILAESPHCLKPLLILADIRAREDGESEEVRRLRSLAAELDPAHTVAASLL